MEITFSQDNIIFFISVAAALLIIFLFFWIWSLSHRLKKMLQGKTINIEEVVVENHKKIRDLETFRKELEQQMVHFEKCLRKSVRAIKTVRFNPFKGTGGGGNQSFSSAFIDEKGDGLVLTGLYHRERVSIFAKPIKNLGSEFELSVEEKQALNEARIDINEK